MNRYSSNLNNSGVWMDNPNNRFQGKNSFGSGGGNNECNVWESRNNGGSRFQFDRGSNNCMGDDGQSEGSFLSFLDQRSNVSRPLIQDAPMSQSNMGQGDGSQFGNRERNWNRNDFNSSGSMNMRGGGSGMRGPLLNEPSQGGWRQSGLLNCPQNEGNNWGESNSQSGGMMSSGNQKNFFSRSNDDSEPVRITLQRKDIGSKIIGKNGVLVRDLEGKSQAKIEVVDKPGTNSAIVEIYGSNDARNYAVQLIKNKCGSSINIDLPKGKPRSLFEMSVGNSAGNNYGQNNQSNNNYGNFRQNSSGGFSSEGNSKVSQQIGPNIAKKALLNNPNFNPSKRFNFNASKRPGFNSPMNNSGKFNFNRNTQGGKKRPWKKPNVKPKSSNNSAGNKQQSQKGQSSSTSSAPKKMKRSDLYSDSDFALEPKSQDDSSVEVKPELGWMDGLKDLAQSLTKVRENFVPPTIGPNPVDNWTKNSQNVFDHFAAGSFETGYELLRKKHGIVNYEPFKQFALNAFTSSKVRVAVSPELPSLQFPLCRKPKDGCDEGNLPALTFHLSDLLKHLQVGYSLTTSGKFSEAVDVFRQILFGIPFVVSSEKPEVVKARKLAIICREYITGLTLEMTRTKLPKNTLEEQKRNCELAAYFTRCNLQASHRMLTLSTALNLFFKLKNFKTAVSFAERLLELEPSPDMIPQLNKIVEVCKGNLVDEHELDYDIGKSFAFCSQTFKRIEAVESEVRCPFCHVRCIMECKGKVCQVCTVADIGRDVSAGAPAEA